MTLTIPKNKVFTNGSLCEEEERLLLDTEFFRVLSVRVDGAQRRHAPCRTMAYCVGEAPCRLEACGTEALLEKGESFVLPAGADYVLSGEGAGVLIYEIDEENGNGPFHSNSTPDNAKKVRVTLPELQPFRIEDMVGFEDGKVVLNTLFGTEQVKLNVMCYDEGQQIGPHGRPFTGWLTVLEGHVHFEVEDEKCELYPGDSAEMPPFVPHMARAEDGNAKYLIMVIRTPRTEAVG